MITRKNVIEREPHKFVAEASDIGLLPGEWPSKIEAEIGNGLPFVQTDRLLTEDGDVAYVKYAQLAGCITLKIFND